MSFSYTGDSNYSANNFEQWNEVTKSGTNSYFCGGEFSYRLDGAGENTKLILAVKDDEKEETFEVILRKGTKNALYFSDGQVDKQKLYQSAKNVAKIILLHKKQLGDVDHFKVDANGFHAGTPELQEKWNTIKNQINYPTIKEDPDTHEKIKITHEQKLQKVLKKAFTSLKPNISSSVSPQQNKRSINREEPFSASITRTTDTVEGNNLRAKYRLKKKDGDRIDSPKKMGLKRPLSHIEEDEEDEEDEDSIALTGRSFGHTGNLGDLEKKVGQLEQMIKELRKTPANDQIREQINGFERQLFELKNALKKRDAHTDSDASIKFPESRGPSFTLNPTADEIHALRLRVAALENKRHLTAEEIQELNNARSTLENISKSTTFPELSNQTSNIAQSVKVALTFIESKDSDTNERYTFDDHLNMGFKSAVENEIGNELEKAQRSGASVDKAQVTQDVVAKFLKKIGQFQVDNYELLKFDIQQSAYQTKQEIPTRALKAFPMLKVHLKDFLESFKAHDTSKTHIAEINQILEIEDPSPKNLLDLLGHIISEDAEISKANSTKSTNQDSIKQAFSHYLTTTKRGLELRDNTQASSSLSEGISFWSQACSDYQRAYQQDGSSKTYQEVQIAKELKNIENSSKMEKRVAKLNTFLEEWSKQDAPEELLVEANDEAAIFRAWVSKNQVDGNVKLVQSEFAANDGRGLVSEYEKAKKTSEKLEEARKEVQANYQKAIDEAHVIYQQEGNEEKEDAFNMGTNLTKDFIEDPSKCPKIEELDQNVMSRIEALVTGASLTSGVILAEPGSGKTFTATEFAYWVYMGYTQFPAGTEVILFDSGQLESLYKKDKGTFDAQVASWADTWAAHKPRPILLLDELHTFIDAGTTWSGGKGVLDSLKTKLSEKSLTMIGMSTPNEWNREVQKTQAVNRRFSRMNFPKDPPVNVVKKLCRFEVAKREVDPCFIYAATKMVDKWCNPSPTQPEALITRTKKFIGTVVDTLGPDEALTLDRLEEEIVKYAKGVVNSIDAPKSNKLTIEEKKQALQFYEEGLYFEYRKRLGDVLEKLIESNDGRLPADISELSGRIQEHIKNEAQKEGLTDKKLQDQAKRLLELESLIDEMGEGLAAKGRLYFIDCIAREIQTKRRKEQEAIAITDKTIIQRLSNASSSLTASLGKMVSGSTQEIIPEVSGEKLEKFHVVVSKDGSSDRFRSFDEQKRSLSSKLDLYDSYSSQVDKRYEDEKNKLEQILEALNKKNKSSSTLSENEKQLIDVAERKFPDKRAVLNDLILEYREQLNFLDEAYEKAKTELQDKHDELELLVSIANEGSKDNDFLGLKVALQDPSPIKREKAKLYRRYYEASAIMGEFISETKQTAQKNKELKDLNEKLKEASGLIPDLSDIYTPLVRFSPEEQLESVKQLQKTFSQIIVILSFHIGKHDLIASLAKAFEELENEKDQNKKDQALHHTLQTFYRSIKDDRKGVLDAFEGIDSNQLSRTFDVFQKKFEQANLPNLQVMSAPASSMAEWKNYLLSSSEYQGKKKIVAGSSSGGFAKSVSSSHSSSSTSGSAKMGLQAGEELDPSKKATEKDANNGRSISSVFEDQKTKTEESGIMFNLLISSELSTINEEQQKIIINYFELEAAFKKMCEGEGLADTQVVKFLLGAQRKAEAILKDKHKENSQRKEELEELRDTFISIITDLATKSKTGDSVDRVIIEVNNQRIADDRFKELERKLEKGEKKQKLQGMLASDAVWATLYAHEAQLKLLESRGDGSDRTYEGLLTILVDLQEKQKEKNHQYESKMKELQELSEEVLGELDEKEKKIIEEQKNALIANLTKQKEEFDQKVDNLQSEVDKLKQQQEKLLKDFSSEQEKIRILQDQLNSVDEKNIEEKKRLLEEVRLATELLNQKIEEKAKALTDSSINDKNYLEILVAENQKKIRKLEQAASLHEDQIKALGVKFNSLDESFTQAYIDFRNKLGILQNNLDTKVSLAEFHQSKSEIDNAIEMQKKALIEKHKEISEKLKTQEEKSSQDLLATKTALEEQIQNLQSQQEKINSDLTSKVTELEKELAFTNKDLKEFREESKKALKEETERLEEALEVARAAADKADTQLKRIIDGHIKNLEASIKALETGQEKLREDLKNQVSSLTERLENGELSITQLLSTQSSLQEQMKQDREELEGMLKKESDQNSENYEKIKKDLQEHLFLEAQFKQSLSQRLLGIDETLAKKADKTELEQVSTELKKLETSHQERLSSLSTQLKELEENTTADTKDLRQKLENQKIDTENQLKQVWQKQASIETSINEQIRLIQNTMATKDNVKALAEGQDRLGELMKEQDIRLSERLKDVEGQIKTAEGRLLQELSEQKTHLVKEIQKLQESHNELYTLCQGKFTDFETRFSNIDDRFDKVETDIVTLNTLSSSLSQDLLEQKNNLFSEINRVTQLIETAQGDFKQKLEDQRKELTGKLETLETKHEELDAAFLKKVGEIEATLETKASVAQVSQLETTLKNAESNLSSRLNHLSNELAQKERELQNYTDKKINQHDVNQQKRLQDHEEAVTRRIDRIRIEQVKVNASLKQLHSKHDALERKLQEEVSKLQTSLKKLDARTVEDLKKAQTAFQSNMHVLEASLKEELKAIDAKYKTATDETKAGLLEQKEKVRQRFEQYEQDQESYRKIMSEKLDDLDKKLESKADRKAVENRFKQLEDDLALLRTDTALQFANNAEYLARKEKELQDYQTTTKTQNIEQQRVLEAEIAKARKEQVRLSERLKSVEEEQNTLSEKVDSHHRASMKNFQSLENRLEDIENFSIEVIDRLNRQEKELEAQIKIINDKRAASDESAAQELLKVKNALEKRLIELYDKQEEYHDAFNQKMEEVQSSLDEKAQVEDITYLHELLKEAEENYDSKLEKHRAVVEESLKGLSESEGEQRALLEKKLNNLQERYEAFESKVNEELNHAAKRFNALELDGTNLKQAVTELGTQSNELKNALERQKDLLTERSKKVAIDLAAAKGATKTALEQQKQEIDSRLNSLEKQQEEYYREFAQKARDLQTQLNSKADKKQLQDEIARVEENIRTLKSEQSSQLGELLTQIQENQNKLQKLGTDSSEHAKLLKEQQKALEEECRKLQTSLATLSERQDSLDLVQNEMQKEQKKQFDILREGIGSVAKKSSLNEAEIFNLRKANHNLVKEHKDLLDQMKNQEANKKSEILRLEGLIETAQGKAATNLLNEKIKLEQALAALRNEQVKQQLDFINTKRDLEAKLDTKADRTELNSEVGKLTENLTELKRETQNNIERLDQEITRKEEEMLKLLKQGLKEAAEHFEEEITAARGERQRLQDEINSLNESQQQLKDHFTKRIDTLKDTLEYMSDDITDQKTKVNFLCETYEQLSDEIRTESYLLNNEIARLDEQLEQLKGAEDGLRKELGESKRQLKAKLSELENVQKESDEKFKTKIGEIENTLSTKADQKEVNERLLGLEADFSQKLQTQKSALEKKLEDLNKDLKNKGEQIHQLGSKMLHMQDEAQSRALAQQIALQVAQKHAEMERNRLKQEIDRVEKEQKQVNLRLQEKVKAVEESVKAVQAEIQEDINLKYNELKADLAKKADKDQVLHDMAILRGSIGDLRQNLEEEVKQADKNLKNQEQRLNALIDDKTGEVRSEFQHEYFQLEKQIQAEKKARALLQEQIGNLKTQQDDLRKDMQNELGELKKQLDEKSNKGDLDELKREFTTQTEAIKTELKTELAKLETRTDEKNLILKQELENQIAELNSKQAEFNLSFQTQLHTFQRGLDAKANQANLDKFIIDYENEKKRVQQREIEVAKELEALKDMQKKLPGETDSQERERILKAIDRITFLESEQNSLKTEMKSLGARQTNLEKKLDKRLDAFQLELAKAATVDELMESEKNARQALDDLRSVLTDQLSDLQASETANAAAIEKQKRALEKLDDRQKQFEGIALDQIRILRKNQSNTADKLRQLKTSVEDMDRDISRRIFEANHALKKEMTKEQAEALRVQKEALEDQLHELREEQALINNKLFEKNKDMLAKFDELVTKEDLAKAQKGINALLDAKELDLLEKIDQERQQREKADLELEKKINKLRSSEDSAEEIDQLCKQHEKQQGNTRLDDLLQRLAKAENDRAEAQRLMQSQISRLQKQMNENPTQEDLKALAGLLDQERLSRQTALDRQNKELENLKLQREKNTLAPVLLERIEQLEEKVRLHTDSINGLSQDQEELRSSIATQIANLQANLDSKADITYVDEKVNDLYEEISKITGLLALQKTELEELLARKIGELNAQEGSGLQQGLVDEIEKLKEQLKEVNDQQQQTNTAVLSRLDNFEGALASKVGQEGFQQDSLDYNKLLTQLRKEMQEGQASLRTELRQAIANGDKKTQQAAEQKFKELANNIAALDRREEQRDAIFERNIEEMNRQILKFNADLQETRDDTKKLITQHMNSPNSITALTKQLEKLQEDLSNKADRAELSSHITEAEKTKQFLLSQQKALEEKLTQADVKNAAQLKKLETLLDDKIESVKNTIAQDLTRVTEEVKNTRNKLQAAHKKLEEANRLTEKEILDLKSDMGTLEANNKKMRESLGKLDTSVASNRALIHEQQTKIQANQDLIDRIKDEVDEHDEALQNNKRSIRNHETRISDLEGKLQVVAAEQEQLGAGLNPGSKEALPEVIAKSVIAYLTGGMTEQTFQHALGQAGSSRRCLIEYKEINQLRQASLHGDVKIPPPTVHTAISSPLETYGKRDQHNNLGIANAFADIKTRISKLEKKRKNAAVGDDIRDLEIYVQTIGNHLKEILPIVAAKKAGALDAFIAERTISEQGGRNSRSTKEQVDAIVEMYDDFEEVLMGNLTPQDRAPIVQLLGKFQKVYTHMEEKVLSRYEKRSYIESFKASKQAQKDIKDSEKLLKQSKAGQIVNKFENQFTKYFWDNYKINDGTPKRTEKLNQLDEYNKVIQEYFRAIHEGEKSGITEETVRENIKQYNLLAKKIYGNGFVPILKSTDEF